CFFISACGRYAFWRLINDQAPEAEDKLRATNPVAPEREPRRFFGGFRGATHMPDGRDEATTHHLSETEQAVNVISRLLRLFR
ncbi:MAG: hypothetical protein KDD44_14760, partial [Bdellovibrionales bacterium]|nr:hypothetical protein [Bdellovibrionales bacterium]